MGFKPVTDLEVREMANSGKLFWKVPLIGGAPHWGFEGPLQ